MRDLPEIADEMLVALSQRWGVEIEPTMRPWLIKSLLNAIAEQAERRHLGSDDVSDLAAFMARQHGLGEDQLDWRVKAARVINAIEESGLSLSNLGPFFLRQD